MLLYIRVHLNYTLIVKQKMNEIYETLDKHYIKFEAKKINVIIDNDGGAWFNAKEIASSLGYKLPKYAIINNVEKKDKIQLQDINLRIKIKKHPHSIYINESGLYSLMLSSRLPKAKKFKNWITGIVLPSIRKYGYYKLKNEHKNDIMNIMKELNYLKKQNEKIKQSLKKEKYPKGGVTYAIDYSDDKDNIYRIGMTGDMEKRKKIYDTHSLYKRKVVVIEKTQCPIQFETCLRAMLYEYRYKNKKDFYICDLKVIRKAFRNCKKSIDCMKQSGGGLFNDNIGKLDKRKKKIEKELVKINKLLEE